MAKAWSPPYDELKRLAAQALSVREMCALLGISEKLFYDHQKRGRKFRQALSEGRAIAVSQCATTVLNAVQGNLGAEKDAKGKSTQLKTWGKKQEIQLNAAMKYLTQHGELWKPAPTEFKGSVKHGGHIAVDVEAVLDDQTAMRMSAALLKSRGVAVGRMPNETGSES